MLSSVSIQSGGDNPSLFVCLSLGKCRGGKAAASAWAFRCCRLQAKDVASEVWAPWDNGWVDVVEAKIVPRVAPVLIPVVVVAPPVIDE